jgi:hypothetical protein
MKLLPVCLLIASAAFADNRWIGGGSTISTASVRAVKSRPGTSTTYFLINEDPGGKTKWYFDNSTAGGKAVLSTLLTALASGTPITFHENTCSSTWNECDVDELLLGNSGPF